MSLRPPLPYTGAVDYKTRNRAAMGLFRVNVTLATVNTTMRDIDNILNFYYIKRLTMQRNLQTIS